MQDGRLKGIAIMADRSVQDQKELVDCRCKLKRFELWKRSADIPVHVHACTNNRFLSWCLRMRRWLRKQRCNFLDRTYLKVDCHEFPQGAVRFYKGSRNGRNHECLPSWLKLSTKHHVIFKASLLLSSWQLFSHASQNSGGAFMCTTHCMCVVCFVLYICIYLYHMCIYM